MKTAFTLRHVLTGTILASALSSAQAATIVPDFVAAYNFGGGLGNQTAGVIADVNAAIGYWNSVLPTPTHTLTIDIRLANLGNDNNAGNTVYTTKDAQGRVNRARLDFNSNTQLWWFDPSPDNSSEFTLSSTYLNKNPNTPDTTLSGCQGPATLAAAQGKWDFLSVAIHEIGHALGIGFNGTDPANFTLYSTEVADGDIDIDAAFSGLYSGAILPVLDIPVTGSHYNGTASAGDFNLTTMATPGWGRGTRALITDLDTLGIASVYDFAQNDVVLTHALVPEPSSFTLAAFGVLALLRRRR